MTTTIPTLSLINPDCGIRREKFSEVQSTSSTLRRYEKTNSDLSYCLCVTTHRIPASSPNPQMGVHPTLRRVELQRRRARWTGCLRNISWRKGALRVDCSYWPAAVHQ